MNHSETHALLTDALTTVNRWAAPLAGRDTKVSSDGLSISYESDPDVGGWSGIADTTTAGNGALLTALLRTGAVEHLQQMLRTAITFVEADRTDDPAVVIGTNAAHEVAAIERFLASEDVRRRQMVTQTAAAADLVFDRFGQPAS